MDPASRGEELIIELTQLDYVYTLPIGFWCVPTLDKKNTKKVGLFENNFLGSLS